MACKPEETFELIDKQESLDNAITLLKDETLLAVKCESQNGAEVSRQEDIVFIMIAIKEKAYVFDVLTMGKTIFTSGLQNILESKSQEKLMFDCREQADALWHQFQVKVSGVLDLQLLEVMYRLEKSASKKPKATYTRRSHRPEEVQCVYGFYHCMELYDLYAKDAVFKEMDDKKRDLVQICRVTYDSRILKKRPLEGYQSYFINFFLTKVRSLFTLHEKLKEILSSEEKDRLLNASERYCS